MKVYVIVSTDKKKKGQVFIPEEGKFTKIKYAVSNSSEWINKTFESAEDVIDAWKLRKKCVIREMVLVVLDE